MARNPAVLNALLVKVDRTYNHLLDFDAEFLRFLGAGNPYEAYFQDGPQAGERSTISGF